MSAVGGPSVLVRRPHFLLLVLVMMMVAPCPATPAHPPFLPHPPLLPHPAFLPHPPLLPYSPFLPHAPKRLPLPMLQFPLKGWSVRPRRVRSALAPPTVTSVRPPDRSRSGKRQQAGRGVGGSRVNISPPVVASQSPSSANTPTHHVYHTNHTYQPHHHQDSRAPVTTATSGSRDEGISIFGRVPSSETHSLNHSKPVEGPVSDLGRTSANHEPYHRNRESLGWDNDDSGTGNSESSTWHRREINDNQRVLDWDDDQGGTRGGGGGGGEGGWAQMEGNVWREVESNPAARENVWNRETFLSREEKGDPMMEGGGESGDIVAVAGGGVWDEEEAAEEEGAAGGGGGSRRSQSSFRNDTYGHVITEDLGHLSGRNSHQWRQTGRNADGGGSSPALAGGRGHQGIGSRHLWVLEEVEEEEGEEGRVEKNEDKGMAVSEHNPPISSDFLSAYLNAVQNHNHTRREGSAGSSYPSSFSSPSSSHPSFSGSSSYHPTRSSSSSTYSSTSKLQDDLSPFHQQPIVPESQPARNHNDEYDPEDYPSYHEYDHHGHNTLPQDETWQTNTAQGQNSNVATHRNQHRVFSIQEIVRLKGLTTTDDLLVLLKKKGVTFHHLLEFVNRGATKSEVLNFLDRPGVATTNTDTTEQPTTHFKQNNDFSSDGRIEDRGNHFPGDERSESEFDVSESINPEEERDDEMNDEVADGSEEQKNRRRNRKKDRKDRVKGRRDRERGRKNRKGKNKGRRRWRQGRKQSTTQAPFSSSSQSPTENKSQTTDSTSLDPVSRLEPHVTTKMSVPMSPWQPTSTRSTQTPFQPLLPTTETPSVIPTTLATTESYSIMDGVPKEKQNPEEPTITPTWKTAKVSEITVTVMETPSEKYDDITVAEDLKPAKRRPNLRGKHQDHNIHHRPREGIYGQGFETDPIITKIGEPSEETKLSQKEEYHIPLKGILIISGLMGALAVFTLVVLISYAVIKCSKKPVVNNYQVSEQKNTVTS